MNLDVLVDDFSEEDDAGDAGDPGNADDAGNADGASDASGDIDFEGALQDSDDGGVPAGDPGAPAPAGGLRGGRGAAVGGRGGDRRGGRLLPAPSQRSVEQHRLACRMARDGKMKKALLGSNVQLRKQVEEKPVWRTSTAIALPGGSALSLAKGRGRRRLTPEEEALSKRQHIAEALGHSTVCVASLGAVAKMYGAAKTTVVQSICAVAEIYVRMQVALLNLVASTLEAVEVPEDGGALTSYSTDHCKFDETKHCIIANSKSFVAKHRAPRTHEAAQHWHVLVHERVMRWRLRGGEEYEYPISMPPQCMRSTDAKCLWQALRAPSRVPFNALVNRIQAKTSLSAVIIEADSASGNKKFMAHWLTLQRAAGLVVFLVLVLHAPKPRDPGHVARSRARRAGAGELALQRGTTAQRWRKLASAPLSALPVRQRAAGDTLGESACGHERGERYHHCLHLRRVW